MANNIEILGSKEIPTDSIKPNPENPRVVFRADELEDLLISIHESGILVPLSVYADTDGSFCILDGERRWRCAKKLNLKSVPANVIPKPDELNNILMMFNIHGVRQGWDYLPTALSLKKVMTITGKSGEKELAGLTGLKRGAIRRCKKILEIPEKYQNALLQELKKPSSHQQLSEDLFLEIIDAIASIQKYQPEVLAKFSEIELIDSFVNKKLDGTVKAVTEYRLIGKIAKASTLGVPEKKVRSTLNALVSVSDAKITEAYTETASQSFQVSDIIKRIKKLTYLLSETHLSGTPVSELRELQAALKGLVRETSSILKKLPS